MEKAEGKNTMRPHQQEFLATDGYDEEECEEQKASYHLVRRRWCNLGVIPPTKHGEIEQS